MTDVHLDLLKTFVGKGSLSVHDIALLHGVSADPLYNSVYLLWKQGYLKRTTLKPSSPDGISPDDTFEINLEGISAINEATKERKVARAASIKTTIALVFSGLAVLVSIAAFIVSIVCR